MDATQVAMTNALLTNARVMTRDPYTVEDVKAWIIRRIERMGWRWTHDDDVVSFGDDRRTAVEMYWHPTVTPRAREAFGNDLPAGGFWSLALDSRVDLTA